MTQLDHDWDLHFMVAETHEVCEHVIGFVGELHRVLWQSERCEGNELGEFGGRAGGDDVLSDWTAWLR
jgi:hypothetical protein